MKSSTSYFSKGRAIGGCNTKRQGFNVLANQNPCGSDEKEYGQVFYFEMIEMKSISRMK
jgi:hypothetical protein